MPSSRVVPTVDTLPSGGVTISAVTITVAGQAVRPIEPMEILTSRMHAQLDGLSHYNLWWLTFNDHRDHVEIG